MNAMSASPADTGTFPAGFMAQAVLDMLLRAERAMDIDPAQARTLLDQAARLLEPVTQVPARAGRAATPQLAPWQERRIVRHIADHIHRPIGNQELAALVGLSVGQFSRRFKASFAISPHGYVIRRRVDRAKVLMRGTAFTLCQIALDSGFCDQAHMARTFRAIMGSAPARWRREQLRRL
ncbi:MAG: helix-turn-helix transcriptional regulator [Caulobacter sp.]|nr:helix-turn-helix transcriptional regulator [Caulobacter sp.]